MHERCDLKCGPRCGEGNCFSVRAPARPAISFPVETRGAVNSTSPRIAEMSIGGHRIDTVTPPSDHGPPVEHRNAINPENRIGRQMNEGVVNSITS